MLWTVLLAAAAAGASPEITPRPRSWFELNQRVREFTQSLILGDTRAMFRMFVPTFKEETDFARFDSACERWRADRRLAMGRGKVVGIRGISGQASTWVVFSSEDDYEYLYQSWVYADKSWQLAWLSNILNPSYDYGQGDSADTRAICAAALDWVVNGGGLASIRPGYARPDTVVVIDPDPVAGWLPDYPTVFGSPRAWRTGTGLPGVPLGFRFALTRCFGSVAVCAVDILPMNPRRRGGPQQVRSIQVFLKRGEQGWQYVATGAIW